MATASSRDFQEIVSKLSSEKARTREEGIKLLNTWLEGERSVDFCKYLTCNTAVLKPDEIPHDETWPFLITLLMDCVLSEISSSKRRLPKLMYAKTLRIAVQKAEDSKGNNFPLITVVKPLFVHIWDVLRDVQSFQSDYGIILRHLLAVTNYRFHMRKKVYSGILLLYMQKVEASFTEKSYSGANPKEEIFRSILTLQSLLENPPGDFPETLRGDVVKGFLTICASLRDEGKISRKIIECLNAYLSEDGPNLSNQALEIHNSVKKFVFHCWLTTHDRSLKATLIMYARLQLNLTRGSEDGIALVEQLLDVVGRELDQSYTSTVSMGDANKEEKFGTLTSSQHELVQLAALVFYRGCMCMNRARFVEKRVKKENVAVHLRDKLMSGKWLWHAAFCYLLKKYHVHLGKNLLTYWFDGICASFERILNDANTRHSYDSLYWTLRSLHGLFRVIVVQLEKEKSLLKSSPSSKKMTYGWQTIWSCLMHDLPMFSHITSVTDASFMLLGDLVSNDIVNMVIVPTDIWDLKCFKSVTSMSVLYFVSSYFSRKGSQGDLRDSLILRKNILRRVLDLCTSKELFILDEHLAMLIPAAVYALSSGIFIIPQHYEMSIIFNAHLDADGLLEDLTKVKGQNREGLDQHFEYYVNALAEINIPSRDKVYCSQNYQGVRLPKQLQDPLLHEMESCIINTLVEGKPQKSSLSDNFFQCSLVSNLIYGSFITRPKDEISLYHSKLFQYLLNLLESAVSFIQDISMEAGKQGFLHANCIFEGTCPVTFSLKSFLQCFPYIRNSEETIVDSVLYKSIIKCIERLLKGLSMLYVEYSECAKSLQFELDSKEASPSASPIKDAASVQSSKSRIIDMELDVNSESSDPTISAKSATGVSSSNLRWKMDIISLISSFFPVLPVLTWDTLFDILKEEANYKLCQLKVSQCILSSLCQNPHWSSSVKLSNLITLMNEMIDLKMSLKLQCFDVLAAICCLLRSLLQLCNAVSDGCEDLSLMERDSVKSLEFLGDLLIKVADSETLDWHGLYFSKPGMVMTSSFGISNFGIKLVVPSRDNVVTAAEVLAAGGQHSPNVETVIITLMHLAFYSEVIEFEAVFMISAISAIEPCQRELVRFALDNLSKHLQYSCRSKYISELMGCILFAWIACGVSLPALVEIRDLFVLDVEPKHFLQYCCQWLIPSLIFRESGSEKGALVLEKTMLNLAEISVDERDKLIKKHMVSIISYILGNASCTSDPPVPLFSRGNIELAVRTVVDGFIEIGDCPNNIGVVDKIGIFRPDRVFMFVVEMHHKVTAAVSPRHRCHRLSGIEVLVNILGHRAAVASTSSYLFNLVGHLISCQSLQDQCCNVISTLLKTFNSCHSKETTHILGEQLQFLVSKLVACCIPLESDEGKAGKPSSQVMSLLHLLTVDSDPSLHDYIREFEPFPEMDIFDRVRAFHLELCREYSPWDHFLKFVKRSCNLPPRLLLMSLQALHKKLVGELFHTKDTLGGSSAGHSYGHCDNNIVQAVWSLVRMCSSEDAYSVRALVADFVSRVGIGDPYSVVFRLAGSSSQIHVCGPVNPNNPTEICFSTYSGLPEELLNALLRILKKYLMDDSVKVVDLTSQTLRGILSTERGQRALLSFDSYERSLIEIHSKGVNIQLVEKCLLELEKKFTVEKRSLEDSALWSTNEKVFDIWICHLVYSLIPYCEDVILRLCQDIVMSKAEIAELLLPTVMVDLAGRKDLDVDLCKIISLQVEQHIFTESNTMTKSTQVMLGALNELRLCQVMEKYISDATPSKRDGSKFSRSSSGYSSKSRSSAKFRDSAATVNATSTLAWEKVYWLSVDYLVVAKAAITCGSYFTSVMYVEHWCEEHFKNMTLGNPDFSHIELVPVHVDILLSAITRINEPDSLYGIIQSNKLNSQIITFEHEGSWSKALEYYDLQVRSAGTHYDSKHSSTKLPGSGACTSFLKPQEVKLWEPHKGLIRCLQQTGCSHIRDFYCQGLISRNDEFQHDLEFVELQYEAAWRTGNWDYSLLYMGPDGPSQYGKSDHFHESLHSCLRALQEGDPHDFKNPLNDLKQGLILSVHNTSEESTDIIYSTIVKLQILDQLTMAWDLRWKCCRNIKSSPDKESRYSEALIPTMDQLSMLNAEWDRILKETQLNMNLLEPFVAFRRVMLQILGCTECTLQHLLHSSSILRKGSRFSQAAASLHEFKFTCNDLDGPLSAFHWLGRLEEAKLLRAQDQHQMAINLGKYIAENNQLSEGSSDVYRLVGKWLAETRSSNSRTILEKYLKRAVLIAGNLKDIGKKSLDRQCQTHFHLAHYADALFRSHEERLNSTEWQAAMRLRKHKGEKTDYSMKILELQKQLTMDKEEAEKLQNDRDNFLNLTLDGYKRCLVVGDKYDVRVVFRLISLWFGLSSRQHVVTSMLSTIKEAHSHKFIPLVYQIASRMGNSKDIQGPYSFQFALVSLVKKMAIDHPYHTIFQLLALANGDRIKDKQRSRNSFVVDMDKKLAAEKLLEELSMYHRDIIKQMKQMVEVYIKLAELETKREDTNKRMSLPRDIRSLRQLELVPVVTANVPVDPSCQYHEGSFPHFQRLADSVIVMNGINAPKVVECYGSDGKTYRQLAKSGNDDLRQDAVMEQFFALVNTFLLNHRDTWKRKLGIRTYKVVPFTPSAGVIEWVDGTLPLGEYLIGSSRNGGAHGRYGAKDKRKAFQEVCDNFRPVMHHFFLERFLQPADWFEKRLAYTRSVAASSMVGYMVGLGDRHSMNILIDQATAEVVHIDLGVAFEQGLMLKTPERVPFRLTRDIIDGMGVTGVEGVFRRCSEQTLAVMRTNKEALLTIVEVFIHDPLYKWALSPLKALQRQKEIDDDYEGSWEDSQGEYEGNKDAARSLLRVKQKLDGYEEGEMRSLHGQVQQLIQDATDSERMCQMFPGWAAWL
ncbi:hypothetical protein V2J09_014994 [Rumex salicifolius]